MAKIARNFSWIAFGSAVAASSFGGCGPRPDTISATKVVGTSARAVQPGEWENAVALVDRGRLTCSGVLVAPTVVLTAAHCLTAVLDPTELQVVRGAGSGADSFPVGIAVARAAQFPGFPSTVWGWGDLAYLIIAEPQNDVAFTPIATDAASLDETLSVGSSAEVVGYGVSNGSSRSLGVKLAATAPVKFRSGREVDMGDATGDGCDGDSGGPAFARDPSGAWRLIGVASRGPSPCGSERYAGTWTLIGPYACWLAAETGWTPNGESCVAAPPHSNALAEAALASLCALETADDAGRAGVASLKLAMARDQGWQTPPAGINCTRLEAWAREVKRVDLSRTMLSDPRPLAAFAAVERLDLEDNALEDVSPLLNLGNLRVVRVGWNGIADAGQLAALAHRGVAVTGRDLQSSRWHLNRGGTFARACHDAASATDAVRRNMEAIRAAACMGSACTCYTASDALETSRTLNLSGNVGVNDLSPLAGLANLQYLDLSGTSVGDLAPLAALENLRHVDLTNVSGDTSVLNDMVALGYVTVAK